MDNARGQWKPYRGWFGTFVENVVQGTARDLLAAAIERFETRGIAVVFHCHDEVTVEVPIGIALRRRVPGDPAEAARLGGRIAAQRQGAFGTALSRSRRSRPAEPLAAADPDEAVLEQAIDSYIDDTRDDIGPIDDPALVEREDDEDFVANLADNVAPLTELVSLPLTPDNKVSCPFHDDAEPSCAIYPDHFHCFGCGEHGSRLDWLTRAEGMTAAEAVASIKDWPGPRRPRAAERRRRAEKLAFVKSIWTSAQPLLGSMAERYLDETRGIDVSKLPEDIHRSLRFHPDCVFGPGIYLPCLIALMRDPLTDAPVGIQRIALEHRDGKIEKIERRMLGRAGVVKLWPAGSQLVVGEGLETVLAAATRIPYAGAPLTPAWAALSSQKLRALAGHSRRRAADHAGRQRSQRRARPRPHASQRAGVPPAARVVPLMPERGGHRFQRSGSEGGRPCRRSLANLTGSDPLGRRRHRARRFLCRPGRQQFMFMPTPRAVAGRRASTACCRRSRCQYKRNGKVMLKPTAWLKQYRRVEQMTWVPGLPEIIEDRLHLRRRLARAPGRALPQPLSAAAASRSATPARQPHGSTTCAMLYPDDADAHHQLAGAPGAATRREDQPRAGAGRRPGNRQGHVAGAGQAAVGPWNFQEISPTDLLGRSIRFVKAVVLRMNEAHDLGEASASSYALYERMKIYAAAPPDVLRCQREVHPPALRPQRARRSSSPPTTRPTASICRATTAGTSSPGRTARRKSSPRSTGTSYGDGCCTRAATSHVAAYLAQRDLSAFDPCALPRQTPAFFDIVNASQAPEDAELADVLDELEQPGDLLAAGDAGVAARRGDGMAARPTPPALDPASDGTVRLHRPSQPATPSDGLWRINGRRQTLYVKTSLTPEQQRQAARDYVLRMEKVAGSS